MNYPYQLIDKLSYLSSEKLIGFKNQSEFEKALCHVRDLILSSKTLLESQFWTQSLFLSITALEEIAKIEVCIFRGYQDREIEQRSKDLLYNHKSKHAISANPVILTGGRLKKSIGEERLNYIFKELQDGKFVEIRENCLYFQRDNCSLLIPSERINNKLAYEILLITIEMIDDKFWGVTNIASKISDELNDYYGEIETKMNN